MSMVVSTRTDLNEFAATGGVAGPLLDALMMSDLAVAIAHADRDGAPIVMANAAFLKLIDASADEIRWDAHSLESIKQRGLKESDLTLTPIVEIDGAAPFVLVTARGAAPERPERATVEARFPGASGAWDWDVPSGRLQADAHFATLSGIPPHDAANGVPGALFFSNIHAEDRLRIQIAVAAALQGAEVFARRYRIVSPDGSVRWVSANGRAYLDENENPIRFAGVLTDITEQKRVEDQLQLAQSAGGIGTFIYESGFGTAEVSSEFCRLLGFHRADSLPVRTINSVVIGDDPPIIGALPSETGELAYSEIRIRRVDDGLERWIALRGQAKSEGGGHRFMGAIYDITDSKRVQNSLRDLNQTLEDRVRARTRERDRLWSLSRDVICVCDAQGVVKAANPAWLYVLGISPDDLVKTPFENLVHHEDREDLRRKFHLATNGRPVQDFDLRLLTSRGDVSSINWSIIAEGGDIYCVGRDVTARLLLQAELHQSQKMEAVGQLTGGIAHDFNNMLTGVIGCLDIMHRRIEAGRTNDLERFMTAATNSAQRAAALTHRLLAFSRRQSLESKPVDLNALTRSMEELLRRALGEQVSLSVELEPDLPSALIDANQLENAILNLAINARDAMGHGGCLTIETSRAQFPEQGPTKTNEIRPGDYVCITVSDTGSGMSPDVLAKAFDPFFTTKPIGQGTGLGLSMVYGFVQQSRGHVVIDSAIDQGTTVRLYLPEAKHVASRSLAQDPGAAPMGDGEQVLIVEDDPSVRLLVLDVLRELNYVGVEAENGRDALEILESDVRIRLLITDVGLPGLSGRQIAEIARHRRPDLPVLFMTAYSPDAINRKRFLEPGMDMISKPFSLIELANKVKFFLGEAPDA